MKKLYRTSRTPAAAGLTTAVITVAAAVLSALLASPSYSAVQGTLGPTSTGSVTISVNKPARARITNLSDLTIASWVSGDGDQMLTDDVCVYSTRPSGGYTIKATGSGASSAFSLSGGVDRPPLNYQVKWNAGGVGKLTNSGTALSANVTSGAFLNAATDSSTCTGATPGDTARLIVEITAANLDAARDGTYTGTLTLLVTPN